MDKESTILIQALRRSVEGSAFSLPENIDWNKFLRLVRFHRVEGLAYEGLKDHPLPEDVKTPLANATHRAVFRDVQQSYISAQLHHKLQETHIPHIFLKGAVLKQHYPVPALRTMSDLDILIRSEDYEALDRVSVSLGGQYRSGDGNHRNYIFPGMVKIEFHPNLLHHATPVAAAVNPGWQYARQLADGTFDLTEEGFFLSILCHMAEHFVDGGIGVRFVLDVWVFHNLRKKPLDRDFVEKELTRFGLLEFVKNIEKLSRVWFDGEPATEETDELGDYILTSGSHGTYHRQLLNAMTMSKNENRFSALWRKAFYPRQELEDRYPWAKKSPLLLPAAWFARAFRAITRHGDQVIAWSKDTGKFSREDVTKQKELLKRFGINKEEG